VQQIPLLHQDKFNQELKQWILTLL
jgi:hypothetical protein